jgi:hypothetical protein
MEQFAIGQSLCPKEFYSITIKPARYHEMKSALYHFLAQNTIISSDNYDVCNIIKKYAWNTDGYQALYNIMARIHPTLDPDAKLHLPDINDYTDVHEYYLHLDAYYMHEKFSGRSYTPRQKLNSFLNGLGSEYQVAATRIRHLMDGWPATETTVPDNLKLEKLPNLVEKYMEEAGKAIVRRVQFRRNKEASRPEKQPNEDSQLRKYVDILCPLCQCYGHPKTHCDRMAVWLHLKEKSKLVDEKLRAIIFANFAKVNAERRAKKMSRLKGTVRQLYSQGHFLEGDQLLENCIPHYQESHNSHTSEMDSPMESESDQSHIE